MSNLHLRIVSKVPQYNNNDVFFSSISVIILLGVHSGTGILILLACEGGNQLVSLSLSSPSDLNDNNLELLPRSIFYDLENLRHL